VFAQLDAAGITTAGGCGDTVRNITGSPVQGIDPLELFDCTEVIQEAADFFYGNPTSRTCRASTSTRSRPRRIATMHPRSTASRSWRDPCGAGGLRRARRRGLSSVPRIARELGVFVPKAEAVEVLAAITGAWQPI